ncbi:flippase [Paenibacillus pectinilyticus]|uniref:Flippase n=1 Tax=Paenibacillus pectinilyticus TaxID=512399 RepID=A0A1C0ZSK0_9BACL|nr:oligosaccharide flippase family protein [Paenibacillus pectinilyticus]OCT11046.1 flippase [Paenibacillus pectinilyticus]
MRTQNSIKNIGMSIFSQVVITLLGFVSRKVFIDSLGIEYLGVNALLINVLSMMALVEGGIGISITYNLYKPLADNDRYKIIALIQLYRKTYRILALIILLISICIYPLLGHFIKDASKIPYLPTIYFLFVFKNMISYFNAHKWTLIQADQKGYILARMELLFQVVVTFIKIWILIVTHNYILYLAIELIVLVFQNIVNGIIVDRKYQYLKTSVKHDVDVSTKDNIIKNIKALFLHNVGSYLVFGTDSLLISSFISIAVVGFYSNYTMLLGQLSGILSPILSGIGASIGNLIATESSEKNYSIFKITYLVNFWLFSIIVIFLYNVLEPFINWWLGSGFLLDHRTYMLILVNFYLTGMRTSIATFKTRAGLFVQDKYVPIIEGILNLIASLVLLRYFDLAGIFMGTTISTIVTVFWTQPLIVYKNIFKKSIWLYFAKYGVYAVLTILTCIVTSYVGQSIVVGNSLVSIIVRGLICITIPNLIYVCLFYKTKEFQYLYQVLKQYVSSKRRPKIDSYQV